MKRGTGKKIILLAVLLAMVGVIVYAVMVCPVNPTRMKPAKAMSSCGTRWKRKRTSGSPERTCCRGR